MMIAIADCGSARRLLSNTCRLIEVSMAWLKFNAKLLNKPVLVLFKKD